MLLATGCNTGYAPAVPGTFGTLAGLPLCFLVSYLPVSMTFLSILAFIIFAIWIADRAEGLIGKKDPGCIVIDEIAGILVTMALLPFSITTAVLGFFIFRIFDILKPFPARYLEAHIDGGAGIVIDDIAAGIMANIVLRCLLWVIGI